MSIALATTTITVEIASEPEPGDGRTWRTVARHVRAQIGSQSGVEDDSPGGAHVTRSASMNCDTVARLDHTCRVTDESTGDVWEVLWVQRRLLLDHQRCGLRLFEGGGR